MSKKLFLKFFLTSFCLSFFCAFSKEQTVFAEEETKDVVNSPNQGCILEQVEGMFNAGSTKLTNCPGYRYTRAKLEITDEKVDCTFLHLARPARLENRKERVFAVLIDSVKGPVDYQFLNKTDEGFTCTLTPPYHSEALAIHIYGQNEDDPDFLLHEENFMCKTKFLPASENMIYKHYDPHVATKYDREGNIIDEDFVVRSSIWQKYTPNIYAFGDFATGSTAFIGVLEFPDGENEKMSYEDRVVPICKFSVPQSGEILENEPNFGENGMPYSWKQKVNKGTPNERVVEIDKYYFNFKIPENVEEFKLKIYGLVFGNTNVCYQGDVSLLQYFTFKLKKNE